MAEEDNRRGNIYSANDPLDINELASLNDEISPEFIEQLQNQVAQNASEFTGKPIFAGNNDSELFEEVEQEEDKKEIKTNENADDNFIKKYKAKLDKQKDTNEQTEKKEDSSNEKNLPIDEQKTENQSTSEQKQPVVNTTSQSDTEIGNLTGGNIIEKPINESQVNYNESLDFLDDNIKYKKYVVYINPENTDFMESLTVKERKNLINRILREQDDIAITKRRLGILQTIIKHTIIVIVTISIAIPITYWVVNASLEASINNYRHSQTIFKTLYREKGKIKSPIQR